MPHQGKVQKRAKRHVQVPEAQIQDPVPLGEVKAMTEKMKLAEVIAEQQHSLRLNQ